MNPIDSPGEDGAETARVRDVPVTLFGHESARASLEVRARSPSWRLRRAAVPAGFFLVLAPVVALVPPHVPWAVGALGAGFYLARRRWKEAFTVVSFDGRCPRCEATLELSPGSRLRFPHSLHCARCRHEPILRPDPTILESAAADQGDGPRPEW